MSSFNPSSTPNFDNLLLQSLMSRLQLHPPPPSNPSPLPNLDSLLLSHSFEDFLLNDHHFSSDNSDEEFTPGGNNKSQLAKEEARLEKDLIKIILSGDTDTLKPNSGQAVSIGEHHVCVGFHEEPGSEYRVWEWHGHVMVFDEEEGYTPEYVYGNYFERVVVGRNNGGGMKKKEKEEEKEKEEKEKEEKVENLGLRELIDEGGDVTGGRILHRSVNAGSTRI